MMYLSFSLEGVRVNLNLLTVEAVEKEGPVLGPGAFLEAEDAAADLAGQWLPASEHLDRKDLLIRHPGYPGVSLASISTLGL